MHQFNVAAQPLAVHAGCERRVGDDADDGGKLRPPHAPQMQVGDLRVAIRFERTAHRLGERVVHLAIEQHLARIAQQALRPDRDHHGAEHAHQRVEPPPAEPQRCRERDDGQHRRQRVGQHVQVSAAQVQVQPLRRTG